MLPRWVVQGGASFLTELAVAVATCKLLLSEELAHARAPAPRLRPGLAEVYRERVAEVTAALAADGGAGLRERVRGLVEATRPATSSAA